MHAKLVTAPPSDQTMMGPGASDPPAKVGGVPAGSQRLSPARERSLLTTLRHGTDAATRERAQSELWQACYGLVTSVANRHRRRGIELADLVSAGQLGLHAAIVRFDPDRFAGRLSTYAVPWIRWYVQDHISRNLGPVRLPSTTSHRQLARWGTRLFEEARRDCERERTAPTETELCARVGRRIGMTTDEVARSRRTISDAAVPVDTLPALGTEDPTPEDQVIRRLDHAKLRRQVLVLAETILGERERVVFLARCMTGDRPVVQLETLAQRFGVSRERIYQLEGSARRKIMTALGNDQATHTAPPARQGAAPAEPRRAAG